MTSDTPPTWEEQLGEQAAAALAANPSLPRSRQRPTLTLISWNRSVADSQKVYRIEHGARPSDRYVLLVSPQDFPDASADEAARMQAMKARLGPRTGRVILDVLGQGRVGGRSFFIVPHCRPLPHGRFAGRIARWRAQGPVLQWLREVCALGVGTPHTAHRTPHTAHRTPHTAHRTPGVSRFSRRLAGHGRAA